MCGIVGYFGLDRSQVDLERMLNFIAHRGPDGSGRHQEDWFGLGHHRLAIIDLSGGWQPVYNEDQSVVMVGNNEIYNFQEIRRDLEARGHRFASRSDTEVVVHAYEEWGENCFSRFNGMFAVILVDRARRRCLIARDHIGIKPVLYAQYRGGYVFASEAKPILCLDGFKRALNPEAFHLFMNFRYLPTEDTLFSGIQKLPQGSYAVIDESGQFQIRRYYSIFDQYRPQKWRDQGEALEAVTRTFQAAVTRHLVADVPVGVYLSGGVDSSLVAAFAAKKNQGIQSFCLTFGEPSDEHRDAERVARHVGTSHATLSVGETPLTMLPEVIWHVEEPKVNCLQGYILAREVRRHVKVALSGMGGDELFAGYTNNDILYPMTLFSRWLHLPPLNPLHRAIASLQGAVGRPGLDQFFRVADLGASLFNPVRFYTILRNCFDHNRHLLKDLYGRFDPARLDAGYQTLAPLYRKETGDVLGRLLVLEMGTKMVNDFLLTEDRVSMGNGLEVRVPFLDKEFIDLCLTLPTAWKYRPGQKKALLKTLVRQELPPESLTKRKWGFSFNPYHQFKKDLRALAEQELSQARVAELGLFNYGWIRSVLDHPPTPRMRWHYFNLWVMVGFSIWHRIFIENLAPSRPDHLPRPS